MKPKTVYVALGYEGQSDARRFFVAGVFDNEADAQAACSGYMAANVVSVFAGLKMRIPAFAIPNDEFANVRTE